MSSAEPLLHRHDPLSTIAIAVQKHRRPRMKRKWLIVAAALVWMLAALGGFFRRDDSKAAWDARIRLRFVGFHTNTATAKTHAQFGIEEKIPWSTEVAWLLREVSHREGEKWVPWNPHTLGSINIDWLHTSNGVHVVGARPNRS